MIRVKICGLTRQEDARAAVRAGADAVGLVFAPSPRQVTIAQAKKVVAGLPVYILRVGVFVNQDPDWVLGVAQEVGLDRIQACGQETQPWQRKMPAGRLIKVLHPEPGSKCPKQDPAPSAAALLVDAYVRGIAGGTGMLSNWTYARGLKRFGKALILSGGLQADNVAQAICAVQPDMVDVSSGVEQKPGIKSAAKMQAFIHAVRAAQGTNRK